MFEYATLLNKISYDLFYYVQWMSAWRRNDSRWVGMYYRHARWQSLFAKRTTSPETWQRMVRFDNMHYTPPKGFGELVHDEVPTIHEKMPPMPMISECIDLVQACPPVDMGQLSNVGDLMTPPGTPTAMPDDVEEDVFTAPLSGAVLPDDDCVTVDAMAASTLLLLSSGMRKNRSFDDEVGSSRKPKRRSFGKELECNLNGTHWHS